MEDNIKRIKELIRYPLKEEMEVVPEFNEEVLKEHF